MSKSIMLSFPENQMVIKGKKVLLLVLLFCVVCGNPTWAQVLKPFKQRTSQYTPDKKIYNIKGDFTMIGNTNMTLWNYYPNENNSEYMRYVDVDNDSNTLNSSSATLEFSSENGAKPQCSHIVYAGLYWTGRAHNGYSPMTFEVSRQIEESRYVEEDFSIQDGDDVPYTSFSLSISRQSEGRGWKRRYYNEYEFLDDDFNYFIFRFYDDNEVGIYDFMGNLVYEVTNLSIQTNNGVKIATFSPVEISIGGDRKITIEKLESGNIDRVSGKIAGTFTIDRIITKNYNKREVYLKHASESGYNKVIANANDIYYPSDKDSYIYTAYAEVTDYVREHGLGEYTVADIALREGRGGSTGYYGGWGLIVVYENSKMKWRDVTLFDGHAFVGGGEVADFELPVSGFSAVQSGDVHVKLGLMAGEGDRGIAGDYIEIRNASDSEWVKLHHAGNSQDNFFNSSIVAGGNARNPHLENNTGLDIAMFDIPNAGNSIIDNEQSATRFRYGTTQDAYVIFGLAMAVDAYVPEPELTSAVMTINGQPVVDGTTVEPGQEIVYTLELRNRGTEMVKDAKISLPVPYTTEYVTNSAVHEVYFDDAVNEVNYEVAEGSTGSLVWNIGDLPVPNEGPDQLLGKLTYTLKVTTDCNILANTNCDPSVAVGGGGGSGTGAVSGNTINGFSLVYGYESNGECQGEPIFTPVEIVIDAEDYVRDHCDITAIGAGKEFVFCNLATPSIPITEVSGSFPAGCRFYNRYPVDESTTEFTMDNEFPAEVGSSITYYAVPPGYTTCYYELKITVKGISSKPTVSDVAYCQNDVASPLMAGPSNPGYTLYYYQDENGENPQLSLTPSTLVVGSHTYYVAEGESASCISPNRVPVNVVVSPKPNPIGIYFN
ncbi:MAG: hypothetical protein ACEPOZ_00160 [Marinifilaceae bacterium]